MEKRRKWAWCTMLIIVFGCPTTLSAQLLTQGGLGSVFQQMDNSAGNTQLWTHSIGVGWFTGIVPQSQLHVNTVFTSPPQNGSFDQTETFRTTVATGFNQQWRMERGALEIGRIYHTAINRSLLIRAVQVSSLLNNGGHLFLENGTGDGIKINTNSHNAVPVTINGSDIFRVGYVALGSSIGWNSLFPSGSRGPWARFHITDEDQGNVPEIVSSFRSWMRNGVMATGLSDLLYMGQLYDGNAIDDNTNAGIVWGDDILPAGPGHAFDHFSMRFVGALGLGGPAGSTDGLELLQLKPFRQDPADDIVGYVGVGNFANTGTEPTESLDVLTRTVRVRQLPNATYQEALPTMVVTLQTDGRLHWADVNDLPTGVGDNDWTADLNGWHSTLTASNIGIGTTTATSTSKLTVENSDGANDIFVLVDQNGEAEFVVDEFGNVSIDGNANDANTTVGIGTNAAAGTKLKVVNTGDKNDIFDFRNVNDDPELRLDKTGSLVLYDVTNKNNQLIIGAASGPDSKLKVYDTTNEYGFLLRTKGQGNGHRMDLMNNADLLLGDDDYSPHFTIGKTAPSPKSLISFTCRNPAYKTVMRVRGHDGQGVVDAFYSYNNGQFSIGGGNQGSNMLSVHGHATKLLGGTAWSAWSDAMLKTDITPFEDGLEKVREIDPVNFRYNGLGNTDTTEMNVGIIAQEMQQIAPYMVYEDQILLDTADSFTTTALCYNPTALQYILVNAVKELDSLNQALLDRVDELEATVAYCCAIISDGGNTPGGENRIETIWPDGTMQNALLFQNQPNPFRQNTTIKYDLGIGGNVELIITDINGVEVEKLVNATQENDSYSLEWETQDLAPGMYFYSLIVDGQLWVKKAVKIR